MTSSYVSKQEHNARFFTRRLKKIGGFFQGIFHTWIKFSSQDEFYIVMYVIKAKCYVGEMLSSHNVSKAKCYQGEMLLWQVVIKASCNKAKCNKASCYKAKCY